MLVHFWKVKIVILCVCASFVSFRFLSPTRQAATTSYPALAFFKAVLQTRHKLRREITQTATTRKKSKQLRTLEQMYIFFQQ